MSQPFSRKQHGIFFRLSASLTVLAFCANLIVLPSKSYAQSALNLPAPGVMATPTPSFIPLVMKGIKIFPNNPLRFDFIIDTGQSNLAQDQLKAESAKLIKYFLATLTVPEDDLWVNLSPYEKDRIISEKFGVTEMGRDLLAQDYVLKQLTASLIYPEKDLGKKFWDKVYAKVHQLYGTTRLPVNTFNKVWIVPDKAVVYENGDTAFIVNTHLKVMLESDYLSLKENMGEIKVKKLKQEDVQQINDVSSAIIKEVILPEIEKEVNTGEVFISLRQVYNSMILATWFKRTLKESFLSKVYVGENKIAGVDVEDKQVKEKIYQQYLETFKKGVYNYIKEDYDPATQRIIPRKYFSGGMEFTAKTVDKALLVEPRSAQETEAEVVKTTDGKLQTVSTVLDPVKNLDRLRRILNVLAQSDQVPQVPQGASEDVILEFVLSHLQSQGLIKEVRDDSTDVKVFVIKDEVKESEIGRAVQRWVMEPRGGVRAINFKGTDGIWKIVSFESDIDQQLDLEREEVKERKAGNHWIVAYNNARQKLWGEDQQIYAKKARQQYEVARKDRISASVRKSIKPESETVSKLSAIQLQRNRSFGLSREAILKNAGGDTLLRTGFDGDQNKLGWDTPYYEWVLDNLQSLDPLKAEADRISKKFKNIVFLGMGGSANPTELAFGVFGKPQGKRIYELKTSDAQAVTNMIRELNEAYQGDFKKALSETVVVYFSQTYGSIEPISLENYFRDLFLQFDLSPQEHFVFTTDPGSIKVPAWDEGYRLYYNQLNNRADIPGRFDAPNSAVFLLPLALINPQLIEPLLKRTLEMNTRDAESAPFVKIAATIYVLATEQNRDQMTLMLPRELRSFGPWLEQLIEESLGKDGKGITVIYDEGLKSEDLEAPSMEKRFFLRINLGGSKTNEDMWMSIQRKGYPALELSIKDLNDLGGLLLGWERIVAGIGQLWGINYVTQPGVERSKAKTKELLSDVTAGESLQIPSGWQQGKTTFGKLALYYQPLIDAQIITMRQLEEEVKILGGDLNDTAVAFSAILRLAQRRGNFDILELSTFGVRTPNLEQTLQDARHRVFFRNLGVATKLSEGPNRNHSIHQNIINGRDQFFSTYFLPLESSRPDGLAEFNRNLLRAQALATMADTVEEKRKAVLITVEGNLESGQEEIQKFFDEVNDYLFRSSSPVKELTAQIEKIQEGLIEDHRKPTKEMIDELLTRIREGSIELGSEEVDILDSTSSNAKVIGRINMTVARQLGYPYQSVDVLMITPDGNNVVLPVWAPLFEKSLYAFHISVWGGMVSAGESYEQALLREIEEETGLASLENVPIFIGYSGYDEPEDSLRLRRSRYVYRLSDREYLSMQAQMKGLRERKNERTLQDVTAELQAEYGKGTGKGESWDILEIPLKQFEDADKGYNPENKIARNTGQSRYIYVNDPVLSGTEGEPVKMFFTPDNIDLMLNDASFMQQLSEKIKLALAVSPTPEDLSRVGPLLKHMHGVLLDPNTGHINFGSQANVRMDNVELWIERHAQTLGNVESGKGDAKIFGGNIEGPREQLDDIGKEQAKKSAEELYNKLKNKIQIGQEIVIIRSQRNRARDTTQPFVEYIIASFKEQNKKVDENVISDQETIYMVNGQVVLRVVVDSRMDEISYGNWAHKTPQQLPDQENNIFRWRKQVDATVTSEKGENFIDVLGRTQAALQEYNQKYKGKTVVVFSHLYTLAAVRINLGDRTVMDPSGLFINWKVHELTNTQIIQLTDKNGELIHDSAQNASSPVSGVYFKPELYFKEGRALTAQDIKRLRSRMTRSSNEIRELLLKRNGKGVAVTSHLRGISLPSTGAIDIPEVARKFTKENIHGFDDLPSMPTVASEFALTVRMTASDNPTTNVYVAPDYGINEDNPLKFTGDIELINQRTPNKQRDFVGYILNNIFGIQGLKVTVEKISPMGRAGGMESSGIATFDLIALASCLTGADLSYADIFNLAVKLENDEFGGRTGGQGTLAMILGGAYRHFWLSGIKDTAGDLINPHSAVSVTFLDETQILMLEKHTMLVQAGQETDGHGLTRIGSLVNDIWMDLVRDNDGVGLELYEEQLALSRRFFELSRNNNFDEISRIVIRLRKNRDALVSRWLELALDANLGKLPKDEYAYAYKYAMELFDENNAYYEGLRKVYHQSGEAGLRNFKLYTYGPAEQLAKEAEKQGIAIMPMGAGGPNANLMALDPLGSEHLREFLEGQGLFLINESEATEIIRVGGVLKGYMPFKASMEPIRFEGLEDLGINAPHLPVVKQITPKEVGLSVDPAILTDEVPEEVISLVQQFTSSEQVEGLVKAAIGDDLHWGNKLSEKFLSVLENMTLIFGLEHGPNIDILDSLGSVIKNRRLTEGERESVWKLLYNPANYVMTDEDFDLSDLELNIHQLLAGVDREDVKIKFRIKQYKSIVEKLRNILAMMKGVNLEEVSNLTVNEILDGIVKLKDEFSRNYVRNYFNDFIGFSVEIDDTNMSDYQRDQALTKIIAQIEEGLKVNPDLRVTTDRKQSAVPGYEAGNIFVQGLLQHKQLGDLPIKIQIRFRKALMHEIAMRYVFKTTGQWRYPSWIIWDEVEASANPEEVREKIFRNFKAIADQVKLSSRFDVIDHVTLPSGRPFALIDEYSISLKEQRARQEAKQSSDTAQPATSSPIKGKDTKGGIDFNPNMLDIEKQGQGIDFNVPVDLQTIQTIQIDGFSPVIFQIIPTNLSMLMGINKAEDTMQFSSIH